MMRIVLLNAYSAGSHAQWAKGMVRELPLAADRVGLEAAVEVLTLPGRHWKWRMHASALTFVERMEEQGFLDASIDAFIVTDMMDVAQLRAALPPSHRHVPIVLYFHENQLTFPEHPERPAPDWDRHYAFMNVMGARLADAVWFNSSYHRALFLEALPEFIRMFPSPRPLDVVQRLEAKSKVIPIGIETDVLQAGERRNSGVFGEGPPVVVWNHRWEYDKGPAAFLDILEKADDGGAQFRLAMMGQSFTQIPEAFNRIRSRFGDRIVQWGHLDSRSEYVEHLASSDVALVTAHHDFFGISVLEAASAGVHIVAPDELAYPEHFGSGMLHSREGLFEAFLEALEGPCPNARDSVAQYGWSHVADDAMSALMEASKR